MMTDLFMGSLSHHFTGIYAVEVQIPDESDIEKFIRFNEGNLAKQVRTYTIRIEPP